MLHILLSIIINTIAVFVTGHILAGIHLESIWTALAVSVVLGIINAFIRPIIFILTLPINIITLGLFSLVIMGCLVYLVSFIVPGFTIDNFWWAIAFGLIVSFINWFFNSLTKRN